MTTTTTDTGGEELLALLEVIQVQDEKLKEQDDKMEEMGEEMSALLRQHKCFEELLSEVQQELYQFRHPLTETSLYSKQQRSERPPLAAFPAATTPPPSAELTRFNDNDKDDYYESDESMSHRLPEDIYSFYACVDYFDGFRPRLAFSIAVVVFSVQVLTLSLFAVDVIDVQNVGNPLGIPAGVDNVVRFSQLIALLITAVSQDETQLSLNILAAGYDRSAVAKFSGTLTNTKWYLSITARFIVGALSYAVTFMLIIRSDTVRDLMLDFTAVSFVSQIDNGAFVLASWGYLGQKMRAEAQEVSSIDILDRDKGGSIRGFFSRRRKIPRVLSLLLMMFGLIIAWMILTIRQIRGEYVEQTIFVQFEDEFWPALATFSGLYQMRVGTFWAGGRDMTYEEIRNVPASNNNQGKFMYCRSSGSWVFQITGVDPATGVELDPADSINCEQHHTARSSDTFTFDITETTANSWYFNDPTSSQDHPLQHFVISPQHFYVGLSCSIDNDCGPKLKCQEIITVVLSASSSDGDRDEEQQQKQKQCICPEGKFGTQCEFTLPCVNIEIDPVASNSGDNVLDFLDDDNVIGFEDIAPWSTKFNSIQDPLLGTPYQVYFMPIYIGDQQTREGHLDVMMYSGRRWILTRTDVMPDFIDEVLPLNATHVVQSLSRNFHQYWSNFPFAFVSDAVDLGKPSYSVTPVGKSWYRVESGSTMRTWQSFRDQSSNALLLCANCDEQDNPCLFGGTCRFDPDDHDEVNPRTCECTEGSYGTLCQIAPLGDGKCDPFFNYLSFEYDEGDCCQRTCVGSNQTFMCGYRTLQESFTGLRINAYVGYDDVCVDPDEICRSSTRTGGSGGNAAAAGNTDDDYCLKSLYERQDKDGHVGWQVSVSGNGAVWASIDEPRRVLRVMEQIGSTYRMRGLPFKNSPAPTIPTVSSPTVSFPTYGIFPPTEEPPFPAPSPFPASEPTLDYDDVGNAIMSALSHDGDIVAIGTHQEGVKVYAWETRNRVWHPLGEASKQLPEIPETIERSISSIALSADGRILAVGYTGNEPDWTEMVQVHKFNSSSYSWDILGQIDLDTNGILVTDRFVSLSTSGLRLAITAQGNSSSVNTTAPQTSTFVVPDTTTVYEYSQQDDGWIEVGGRIEAHGFVETIQSMSISGDGNRIATSSVFIDVQNTTVCPTEEAGPRGGGGSDSTSCTVVYFETSYRRVSIYDYNAATNAWEKRENMEWADVGLTEAPSLALSGDGNVLAVGRINGENRKLASVNLFKYSNVSQSWDRAEATVDLGPSEQAFIPTVSLSFDGSRLVVGKYDSHSMEAMFQYNTFETAPALSNSTTSNREMVSLSFAIELDDFPEHTAISLTCGDVEYGSPFAGKFFVPNEKVETEVEVEKDLNCEFVMFDTRNNGVCCEDGNGSYSIYIGVEAEQSLIAMGGGLTFGSSERVLFTASPPETLIPLTVRVDVLDMVNVSSTISTTVVCNGAFESESPVVVADDLVLSQITTTSTYLVPEGASCMLHIRSIGGESTCENCSIRYFIEQEAITESESRVLVDRTVHPWLESLEEKLHFTVTRAEATTVPITVVVRPDTFGEDISFQLHCKHDSKDDLISQGALFGSNGDYDDLEYKAAYFVNKDASCFLSVADGSGDGMCCNKGLGYFQLYRSYLDETNAENLIYEGGEFDSIETIFFKASSLNEFLSKVTVSLELSRRPYGFAFIL